MFGLRNMFIHTIFCVVVVRVASEWKSYNGLWYYISKDNYELLTYAESEDKCKLMNGRMAVFPGWPDDRNKLASFTGSTRRWIHGNPQRVILESEGKHVLKYPNVTTKYGYICDWQCQSLGVYPQSLDNTILADVYKQGGSLYNLTQGVYDLNVVNDDLRQFYIKQPQTHFTHVGIYQNWKGNDTHIWCFKDINHTEKYICKISTHFTPYNNDSYPWLPYKPIDVYIPDSITSLNIITVNFFCHDCKEYEILVRNGSNIMSGIFRRSNDAEVVVFTYSEDFVYLEYDSDKNQWCLKWTPYLTKYCFDYRIAPTVNYTIFVSSDLDIVISLSCTSTTFPIQQSTVASMESETTMDSNVILAETTAASAISSVTNSHAPNTVTDEFGLTTKESRSGDARLENKTTMYVAIACAIGGVVMIIFISVAAVCCRRRMKNKRKPDTEQSIQNNMRKSKANIYSVDTQSTNYAEIKTSIVVENKTGKANSEPLYEQAKDPTTENVYSEAEAVDSNIKQMYINGDFVLGSSESQNEAGSYTSDMKTGNKTADDGNDSETEFFNNNIYEGNVNMDSKSTEVPQPIPVKSPSGSDIEMYNNSLNGACGKGIAQTNKSELVKNMDSVDEDIEMYDNELYGS